MISTHFRANLMRVMAAVVVAIATLQGCGKSKAVLEAEKVVVENAQREQKTALEEAIQRAEDAEQRAANVERKAKDLASESAAAAQAASSKTSLVSSLQMRAAAELKDPTSAQFRNVTLNERTATICGEINAKNSFGGYSGFRPFVASADRALIEPAKCSDDRRRGSSVESQLSSLDAQIQCQLERNAYVSATQAGGC